MPLNIMVVFGTRPEAIKMALICKILKQDKKNFITKICVTAQHREMLDKVLDTFDLKPDIDLNIMKTKQSLSKLSSSIMISLNNIFKIDKPDLLLVHGDTTTSFIASLTAFYHGINIAHVEAGLRTNNIYNPYPEELNRQIISKIANIHFSPTIENKKNLISEGVIQKNIKITGNTVIDSLHWVIKKIDDNKSIKKEISQEFLKKINLNLEKNKYILITGHRRENFGTGFLNICNALKILAKKYKYIHFIYPVHLNPNVQKPVNKILGNIPNIHLIEPLKYESFIFLLKNCFFILTDSGGIQEEAPSLGKPVLLMRKTTERPECIAAGNVILVGTTSRKIVNYSKLLIDDPIFFKSMSKKSKLYGDGKASKRIVNFIKKIL